MWVFYIYWSSLVYLRIYSFIKHVFGCTYYVPNVNLIVFQNFTWTSIQGSGLHLVKEDRQNTWDKYFVFSNHSLLVNLPQEFSPASPGMYKFLLANGFCDLSPGNNCSNVYPNIGTRTENGTLNWLEKHVL